MGIEGKLTIRSMENPTTIVELISDVFLAILSARKPIGRAAIRTVMLLTVDNKPIRVSLYPRLLRKKLKRMRWIPKPAPWIMELIRYFLAFGLKARTRSM